jgi:DNA-binding NarL/FixJ family response regulator
MRDVLKVKPDTKIIILSADDSVRTEAIRAGANIFLLKPVRNSVMVETIKSL